MPSVTLDTTQYRSVLERRLAFLENRLETIEDKLDDPKSRDWEEQAVESEGDEVMEGLGNSGLEEIRAIKAALARIDNGSFGECAKCGKEISSERLDAVPHTPFCRECARR
ncbi:MAG: TraR/DksA C4-type zinc finger protein [Nitratireductor sp.]|nr:TraR/DksA C4-type zinc finger protein [Nitratireductor sp.]